MNVDFFALPDDHLRRNAAAWARAHLRTPPPSRAEAWFRLVHRAPVERIDDIVAAGVIQPARRLRSADPDAPTRTFPMDEALGLDRAVFFTPGFATQDSSHRGGAAIVLSASASARLLADPAAR